MNTSLSYLIEQFANLNMLVIGEAILDSYLRGAASRLCQEAPVPVVSVLERDDSPGGAANTAVNVRALGGQATLLSVIGDDAEGALLHQALTTWGVSTDHVLRRATRRTLAKQRVMADAHILVRFDQGSVEAVDEVTEQALIDRLISLFPQHDAVIVSDYGYGILTPRVIQTLALLQARMPRILVADARNLADYRAVGVTAVKPNYQEALRLLDMAPTGAARVETMTMYGGRVLTLTGAQIAAVTLDAEGALIFEQGSANNPASRPYRTYARATHSAGTPGAGDTFTCALTLALAAGADTPTAAEVAAAAANVTVQAAGTTVCTAAELQAYVTAGDTYLHDMRDVVARLAVYRRQGRRIVLTNGCFDILHRGHVLFLNQAKALGDVLVVGINTDASVRCLKGPARPINTLEDRVQVLAALSCVDSIVAFDELTPCNLIEMVRPDVFVKGGDYTREQLPEAPLVEQLGGIVHILPYVEREGTTRIIQRIRAGYALREVGG